MELQRIDKLLPAHGDGWTTYYRGRHGEYQYGTSNTIGILLNLAYHWYMRHPTHPIQIGHISLKGGGKFPPHITHQEGRDVDLRPFRDDGLNLPVHMHDRAYSPSLTVAFLELVHRVAKPIQVLHSGPLCVQKGLSRAAPGHENHIHIRF